MYWGPEIDPSQSKNRSVRSQILSKQQHENFSVNNHPPIRPPEDELHEEQHEKDDELSLHDAIMLSHYTRESEGTSTSSSMAVGSVSNKRKPIKPDAYFSDEDASSD